MPEADPKVACPAEWPRAPLEGLCRLISRGKSPAYVQESDVLAIGQRCVQGSGFDWSAARPHDPSRLADALFAVAGDVLLNSTGTGTIGRSCVFNGDPDKYVVDGHVTLMRTHDGRADGRWLNALLQLESVQQYLASHCYSGSTNQIELSRSRLEALRVPVPPLPEQRRIADILDTADDTIWHTERLIAKLKAIKIGLLNDVLTRGFDEHGRLRDPEAHPEQFKDSPLGTIPREWKVSALNEAAQIAMGQSPAGNTYNQEGRGTPLINGPAEFGDRYPCKLQWTTAPTKLCRPGDILFCVRGSTTGRLNLSNDTYCIGRGIAAIQGRDQLATTGFVELLLRRLAQSILSEARGSGSTFPNITSDRLAVTPVVVPSIREQRGIVAVLEAHEESIRSEEAELAKYRQVKRGLMDDLLTGKVRVTDA